MSKPRLPSSLLGTEMAPRALGPTGSTNPTGSHAWLPCKSHCAAPAKETGRGHSQALGFLRTSPGQRHPWGARKRWSWVWEGTAEMVTVTPGGDSHLTVEEAKAKATQQGFKPGESNLQALGPPGLGPVGTPSCHAPAPQPDLARAEGGGGGCGS